MSVVAIVKSIPLSRSAVDQTTASFHGLARVHHYACDSLTQYYDPVALKREIDGLALARDESPLLIIVEAGMLLADSFYAENTFKNAGDVGYGVERVEGHLVSRVLVFRYSSILSYEGYAKLKVTPRNAPIRYYNNLVFDWLPAIYQIVKKEFRWYFAEKLANRRGLSSSAPEFYPHRMTEDLHIPYDNTTGGNHWISVSQTTPVMKRREMTPPPFPVHNAKIHKDSGLVKNTTTTSNFAGAIRHNLTTFDLLYHFFLSGGVEQPSVGSNILLQAKHRTNSRCYRDWIDLIHARTGDKDALSRLQHSPMPTIESLYLLFTVTHNPVYLQSAYVLSRKLSGRILFMSYWIISVELPRLMLQTGSIGQIVDSIILDDRPLRNLAAIHDGYLTCQVHYAITPEPTVVLKTREALNAYFRIGDNEAYVYRTSDGMILSYINMNQETRQLFIDMQKNELVTYSCFLYSSNGRHLRYFNLSDSTPFHTVNLPITTDTRIFPAEAGYYAGNRYFSLKERSATLLGRGRCNLEPFTIIAIDYPYFLLRCNTTRTYRLYVEKASKERKEAHFISPPLILLLNEEITGMTVLSHYDGEKRSHTVSIASEREITRYSLSSMHME